VSGKRIAFYKTAKVEVAEGSASFSSVQKYAESDLSRNRIAQHKEIREYFKDRTIGVPKYPEDQLRLLALKYHNERLHRDVYRQPLLPAKGFWEAIEVDYLLTICVIDDFRDEFRVGTARKIVKIETEKVLEQITAVYPALASECQRRLQTLRQPISRS